MATGPLRGNVKSRTPTVCWIKSPAWDCADRIFGDAARWLRSSPFVPALLALGFATGFIHYLLDRAVFRFSSSKVRQAARGLLRS